jgi:hypothetical protein
MDVSESDNDGSDSSAEALVELNREFYEGNPADYVFRRLVLLAIEHGLPEVVDTALKQGITAGAISLRRSEGPNDQSLEREARAEFVVADLWQLLHHASESLLRLYFAHVGLPESPALEMAKVRDFRRFKDQVRRRFAQQRASQGQLEELGLVFCGVRSAERFKLLDDDEFRAMLENIEGYLRFFARTFLNADSYNAAKHGIAIRAGFSRLTLEIEGQDFGGTEGAHVDFLRSRNVQGKRRWELTTEWFDRDKAFAQVMAAKVMIEALWAVARNRYLGEPIEALPRLDQIRHEHVTRSETITWSDLGRRLNI